MTLSHLFHIISLFPGNPPFNMGRAADCLERWARGQWEVSPLLKVDWPETQVHTLWSGGVLAFLPAGVSLSSFWKMRRSLPSLGPSVGPAQDLTGMNQVTDYRPVPYKEV